MNSTRWFDLQEKGSLIALKFVLNVYRFLGRIPFLIILYPVVLYYFIFSSTARNASIEFLNKVGLKGGVTPAQPILWQSYLHFVSFGHSMLEKLIAWLGAINYENVDFPDQSKFFELIESKRGALIIGSHLGNLEVMRALTQYNEYLRLNILVHTKNAEKFNQLMKKADENTRLNMIQVTEITPATAMHLQRKLSDGEFVVIMGDRVPIRPRGSTVDNRTSVVDFLGSPAPFSQGPYLIGALMKCPVYTLFCIRDKDRYTIEFRLFEERLKLRRGHRKESLDQYAAKYAKILESKTLEAPLQWNNFFPFWDVSSVGVDGHHEK